METLTQIRNGLLQKLKKKKSLKLCSLVMCSNSKLKRGNSAHNITKGDRLENRVASKVSVENCKESDSLKKRDKSGEKQTKADESSKKENNTNENLISLYKQHKKNSGLSRNLNTSGGLSSNPKRKHNGRLDSETLKRKRKVKRKNDEVIRDEALYLQRRARYLLVKLKLEQNLIDAYTREGWKGQSREKIKPKKELERAKKQILNCKLDIRDTVRQLDLLGSVGKIDDSFISSDGSVHHEHIICKICKSQEVSEDNDIILCDGTCNCAFHQKCIDPPLATEDIPPEDEGWLCKYCDCKMDLLEAMNAHLGTEFSYDCTWQDIFKEEALLSETETKDFNPEEEWPDDESDDNDYHPGMDDIYTARESGARDESDTREETSSTSCSNCSLESEGHRESGLSTESNEILSDVPILHQNCVVDSNDNEIMSGPRQRSAVDYKKLYDEMFAKDISNNDVFSDDEDWDPHKRRRRGKECDAVGTLMKLSGSEEKPSGSQSQEAGKDHPSGNKPRKLWSKIPHDVLQKLRQTFAENELPSRDVKIKISEDAGLEYAKVNKWFKNARYLALKKRKRQGSQCTGSNKSDIEVDEDTKGTILECSSPVSIQKKRLKRVGWNDNLATLIWSTKKKRLKRTSVDSTKANVEPSDDTSLKKLLLCLKAKNRQAKGGRPNTTKHHRQAQIVELQIEQLCQIDAKLWKLKQIVSTFPNL